MEHKLDGSGRDKETDKGPKNGDRLEELDKGQRNKQRKKIKESNQIKPKKIMEG